MASKTWASKWHYIRGRGKPASRWQRVREWAVSKWSSGIFTPDDAHKHRWHEVYVRDGSRPSALNKRVQHIMSHNGKLYQEYKDKIDAIAKDNALALHKKEVAKTALATIIHRTFLTIDEQEQKKKERPRKSYRPTHKKETVHIHFELPALTSPFTETKVAETKGPAPLQVSSITYQTKGYDVKDTTRRLSVPYDLINQFMNDPFLNPLIKHPEVDAIRDWANDTASLNPSDRVQITRGQRHKLAALTREWVEARSIQNRIKIAEMEGIIKNCEYYEKAILWNARAQKLRDLIADQTWAELTHKPLPYYTEPGSGYESYVHQCKMLHQTPKLPPTSWDVFFYLRWLNPIFLVDAVVGGLCEEGARLTIAGLTKFYESPECSFAYGAKVFFTWPFAAVLSIVAAGCVLVDAACHFVAKATTISGVWDGLKTLAHGAQSLWKKCFGGNEVTPTRKSSIMQLQHSSDMHLQLISDTKGQHTSAQPAKKTIASIEMQTMISPRLVSPLKRPLSGHSKASPLVKSRSAHQLSHESSSLLSHSRKSSEASLRDKDVKEEPSSGLPEAPKQEVKKGNARPRGHLRTASSFHNLAQLRELVACVEDTNNTVSGGEGKSLVPFPVPPILDPSGHPIIAKVNSLPKRNRINELELESTLARPRGSVIYPIPSLPGSTLPGFSHHPGSHDPEAMKVSSPKERSTDLRLPIQESGRRGIARQSTVPVRSPPHASSSLTRSDVFKALESPANSDGETHQGGALASTQPDLFKHSTASGDGVNLHGAEIELTPLRRI